MPRGVSAAVLTITMPAILLAGCGSPSPTGPEMPPGGGSAGYQNRPMLFSIGPADYSGAGNEPTVPACVGSAAAGLGRVMVPMIGSLTSDVFTAEASSPPGDTIRIRLQRTVTMGGSPGLSFSIPMSGWVEGSGTHHNIPALTFGDLPATAVRFDGRVQMTSEMPPDGYILDGRITGAVTFISEAGTQVPCEPGTVFWHMSGAGGF
jgi:hypothetical protein